MTATERMLPRAKLPGGRRVARSAPRSAPRSPLRSPLRPLLVAVALTIAGTLFSGCGLVPAEPIDFRTYSLRETTYAEAERVVREVTARWFTSQFGGLEVTWDAGARNMSLGVIVDTRKLDLMIHLDEMPDGADVEMLALVKHALPGAMPPRYGDAQMDVFLEQTLHQAWVDELRARRAAMASAAP